MKEEHSEKVFVVKEAGGEFLIKGSPDDNLNPRYLAMNPRDAELFLLSGEQGNYSLLKGNLVSGLRFCSIKSAEHLDDHFSILFEQEFKLGLLTDPDILGHQPPYVYIYGTNLKLQPLEIVRFRLIQ